MELLTEYIVDFDNGKEIIVKNFTNWTSGNNIIDNFIQEKQLKLNNNPRDRILEWIPYDEFIDIKEIGQSGLATTAWKEGPLFYYENEGWIRLSYQKVILKFLYDSENITDEFINKVESYLADDYDVCYGISQNPDTKDYILIFSDDYLVHRCKKCGIRYYNWCQPCQVNYLTNNFTNWTSGNERIDNFIQEKQLKYDRDTVFEWIPYDKLIDINEIGECDLTTAIWKDGPLSYDTQYNKEWMRKSYEKICLRYLYNSQEVNDEFINKIESFLLTGYCYEISKIPGTTDYIIVFSNYYFGTQCKRCGSEYENYNYHCSDWCKLCRINQLKNDFTNWTSGNKIIDNFIQEIQLKDCKVFEWIPYDEFFDINEIGKIGLTTAIWKNGPLNTINEFINKVKSYLTDFCYGISQNPDTKDYILVYPQNYINKYCKECGNKYEDFHRCKPCIINYLKNNFINWTSGNEKIDNFIQETQLKSDKYNDTLFTLFEWIPYVGFTDINEIRKGKFAMAIWKDGPLSCPGKWERGAPEKVYLKYLHNSQDITETLSEIKCSMGHNYGISQDPSTKYFILVLQHMYYCKKCGEKYKIEFEINNKSCMSCQISHENEKISDLIQEMKLSQTDIIFEWIPYNQFKNVEEIGKGGFSTVYSAIWKDGLIKYDEDILGYKDNILKMYGVSQNPNTKDYIIVLEYAEGGDFKGYLDKNYEKFDLVNQIKILVSIIGGLNEIHQKWMVHRDLHIGNILLTKTQDQDFLFNSYNCYNYNACISDMGLCKKLGETDETNIYGVMPYVAPEVLRGKPYTRAADIYSFGMIMYFVATGKQPFADCAHDEILAISIYKGYRPEINEKIVPKFYIDLMKRCWDMNPDNRPTSVEVKELIDLFYVSINQFGYGFKVEEQHLEIRKQFKESVEYREANPLPSKSNQIHTQAIFTSRLLNPFTKNLPKYDDNINNNSVEITDFMNL
ncbi:unnamed protein product [Rhizophagus irregularis]|nr:unnamed protein product [Rhizophagus irregularis]